jgi:hypothetical protein
VCPYNKQGRNGRHFCTHPNEDVKEILRKDFPGEDKFPAWCPLESAEDFAESNFNIDRKF